MTLRRYSSHGARARRLAVASYLEHHSPVVASPIAANQRHGFGDAILKSTTAPLKCLQEQNLRPVGASQVLAGRGTLHEERNDCCCRATSTRAAVDGPLCQQGGRRSSSYQERYDGKPSAIEESMQNTQRREHKYRNAYLSTCTCTSA